ncbi:MAG TPA: hypothetical protein PKN48_11200 [Bacteroidales bacterium]|nr:hypothetical protein [Bacteroidales bacterium]HNW90221.1 hypothetical protein [Bacteroidales bacterium]
MKKNKITILLTACLLILPFFVNEIFAQGPPPPEPANGVPLDGLGFLAALGIIYGVKKLRDKKK